MLFHYAFQLMLFETGSVKVTCLIHQHQLVKFTWYIYTWYWYTLPNNQIFNKVIHNIFIETKQFKMFPALEYQAKSCGHMRKWGKAPDILNLGNRDK